MLVSGHTLDWFGRARARDLEFGRKFLMVALYFIVCRSLQQLNCHSTNLTAPDSSSIVDEFNLHITVLSVCNGEFERLPIISPW